MTSLAEKIVAAIESVVGVGPVALHEPTIRGNEWKYLRECLDTACVSSEGRFLTQFEADLARFTGARYVVAVSSGTAALHIALLLAGVKDSDEVLVPDLSFVATSNAVTYCGAIPHFIECEEETLGVDSQKVHEYLREVTEQRGECCVNKETGRVIRAIVPMHTFGHPVQMEALLKLANDHKLAVIEDAAESVGSLYRSKHTGTFGLAGVLSFNGNKTITTGSGGAILTDHSEIASRARHLSRTAKVSHAWDYIHDEIGYNYRMSNLNAALGCAQLEQLPQLLEEKRRLFSRYNNAFSEINNVKLFSEPPGCTSNYWLQALLLDTAVADNLSDILTHANTAGYMLRPAWRPLSSLGLYKNSPKMQNTKVENLAARIINIPSNPELDPYVDC
jgi:perosamine synthetase